MTCLGMQQKGTSSGRAVRKTPGWHIVKCSHRLPKKPSPLRPEARTPGLTSAATTIARMEKDVRFPRHTNHLLYKRLRSCRMSLPTGKLFSPLTWQTANHWEELPKPEAIYKGESV